MGFNMNNDVWVSATFFKSVRCNFRPTNWQWENLYDNIDDAKVILTVRGKSLKTMVLRTSRVWTSPSVSFQPSGYAWGVLCGLLYVKFGYNRHDLDDEEKWLKSWQTFCDVQTHKHGLWSSFFLPILMHTGLLGQMQSRFDNLVLKWLCGVIGFPPEEWCAWKMHLEYAGKMDPEFLKSRYL